MYVASVLIYLCKIDTNHSDHSASPMLQLANENNIHTHTHTHTLPTAHKRNMLIAGKGAQNKKITIPPVGVSLGALVQALEYCLHLYCDATNT